MMISLIEQLPFWFWIPNIAFCIYTYRWLFAKTNNDPIILKLGGALLCPTLFLMMLDSLVKVDSNIAKYVQKETTNFLLTITTISAISLMGIGIYKKINRPDFDPNRKIDIFIILKIGIIFFIILAVIIFLGILYFDYIH